MSKGGIKCWHCGGIYTKYSVTCPKCKRKAINGVVKIVELIDWEKELLTKTKND